MKSSILRKIKKITLLFLLCVVFFSLRTNAQSVFDANFNDFSFLAANRVHKVGTDGSAAGNVTLYTNVITISGQQIDCIVRTISLTGGTFTLPAGVSPPNIPFDVAATSGTSFSSNADRYFSPTFNWTAAGSCKFRFEFILGGSYNNGTNTGTAVIIQNAYVNTYDIDGNGGANSNQHAEFGGYQSAQFVLTSGGYITATYNSTTGLTKFRSKNTSNSATVTADNTRIKVIYDNLSVFETVLGADGGGVAYYFLDFGGGPVWTLAPPVSLAPVLSCSATNVTSCASPNSGTASVTVTSGGSSPFTYSWNSSPIQTTSTATGLPADTYTVVVTDNYGLSALCSSTVLPPPHTNSKCDKQSDSLQKCKCASNHSFRSGFRINLCLGKQQYSHRSCRKRHRKCISFYSYQ